MKNATVVLSVVFQLNREWMITALLQAKYLNSINGLKKTKTFTLVHTLRITLLQVHLSTVAILS